MATNLSVAVLIPTRNRKEILATCLRALLSQSVAAQILVLDDGSSDGTEQMVRCDFPQVAYFRENDPKGPAFERNKGASLTSAEIIFTIDDDCMLKAPDILSQTLQGFDHPRIAAVTIPFINVLRDSQVHQPARSSANVDVMFDYFGGMVAFRRNVYCGVGGYRSSLFMNVEESDLAVRLMNAGYVVRVGWATPLEHMESPLRNRPKVIMFGARNSVLYAHYNVPMPDFPLRLVSTSLSNFLYGARMGHPFVVLRGLFLGYWEMWRQRRERRPMGRGVYRLTRRILRNRSLPLQQVEPSLPPLIDF